MSSCSSVVWVFFITLPSRFCQQSMMLDENYLILNLGEMLNWCSSLSCTQQAKHFLNKFEVCCINTSSPFHYVRARSIERSKAIRSLAATKSQVNFGFMLPPSSNLLCCNCVTLTKGDLFRSTQNVVSLPKSSFNFSWIGAIGVYSRLMLEIQFWSINNVTWLTNRWCIFLRAWFQFIYLFIFFPIWMIQLSST